MFDNIGGKIKELAWVMFFIGSFISIVFGVVVMVRDISTESIFIGLLICIIGPFLCWISSFTLYGLGQVIENSEILVKTLVPIFGENMSDSEKLKNINDEELERISRETSGSSWSDNIKKLSDDVLQERMDSEEWEYEYRALCKKELENRKQQ